MLSRSTNPGHGRSRDGKVESRQVPRTKTRPGATLIPKGYEAFLVELKDRIRTAQLRASIAVNHELIAPYWQVGKDLIRVVARPYSNRSACEPVRARISSLSVVR
jgi:hypothetical protein